MQLLLEALEADPSSPEALLRLLNSMTRKISTFESLFFELEPTLKPDQRAVVRRHLAQELLLDD